MLGSFENGAVKCWKLCIRRRCIVIVRVYRVFCEGRLGSLHSRILSTHRANVLQIALPWCIYSQYKDRTHAFGIFAM